MATAIVFPPVAGNAVAAATGLDLTFDVAFGLDSGAVDMDVVTINVAPGDTASTLMTRLSSGVSKRATERGYSVAKSAITILSAFSKG